MYNFTKLEVEQDDPGKKSMNSSLKLVITRPVYQYDGQEMITLLMTTVWSLHLLIISF